jgi:hypothetical protein
MGFFSWKTQDTNKSIPNIHCGMKTFTVYMKDNAGNVWKESAYDGYGEFGGKDFYALLAEMNGFGPDREIGIDIYFKSGKHFREIVFGKGVDEIDYPNIHQYKKTPYDSHARPEDCPEQGYFYENDPS